jgi:hypothetical protein
VPNVFVVDLEDGTQRRLTGLATGAFAHDWIVADTLHTAGSIILNSNVSKRRDQAFRVDAGRTPAAVDPEVPEAYEAWVHHRPPEEIPLVVEPDAGLITARGRYHSWRNITHVASLVLPYYASTSGPGLFGMTAWIEPLGKHAFMGVGGLALGAVRDESFLLATYVNNQWHPTATLSAYRFPGATRFYGNDLLVERLTGGDLSAEWPLDLTHRPFHVSSTGFRLRFVDVEPLPFELFSSPGIDLPEPESGRQADLRLTFTHRLQRPYRDLIVHPLDGFGVRLNAGAGYRLDTEDPIFGRSDVAAFGILPMPALHRLFLHGRLQAQWGRTLPQDFIGFARHDELQISVPGQTPLTLGENERVRGFRDYVVGNRVLFGSAEYRFPLLSDLQTRLLGLVSLGATAGAVFVDAGAVWSDGNFQNGERRAGAGLEVKNALRVGFFEVMHALGVAQPIDRLGPEEPYEVYYRIRAAVPF